MPKSLDARKYFLLFVALLILVDIAVALNIPVLRQVLSFVFLTFLPGWLIVHILRLNNLDLTTKIVLSIGLSVAFLMFFGLLVNSLLLALGYARPLSIVSLLISFNLASIVLAAVAYIRNRNITFSFLDLKLNTREKAFLIMPSLFPLLSIIGMRIMNLTDNNIILMLLLFLVPAYVVFLSFYNRRVPEKVYPAVIFLISISLLLMYSLRSNHVIGGDIHRELFIVLTILDNLHWSQLGFGYLDTCLSISMLPVVYQTFLNIDPEYLFKLYPSLIVSISPLVVYLLSKKYIGTFYAFLASFFFMSQIMFLWTPAAARGNIAILFFALAIMVIFHDDISEFSKRVLFIVFLASSVVSHYGVTYTSFFALLFAWIGMQILSSITSRRKKPATLPTGNPVIEGDSPSLSPQERTPPMGSDTTHIATGLEPSHTRFRRGITITVISLYLTMLFFWYSQMHGPTFAGGVRVVYKSFVEWTWVFAETFGGQQAIVAALGKTLPYAEVPQKIEFVFSWLTIILVSVGVLTTIVKFKTMVSIPFAKREKPNFLLKKLDAEYLVLSIGSCLLLVVTVALPHISKTYGSATIYFHMMVTLSVFCVIGGITASRFLKSRPHWILIAVLIPYFLCTTGAMAQMFSFPRNITLNSEGKLYDISVVYDGDSYAAKWLKEYRKKEAAIYTNGYTKEVLTSQGKIPYSKIKSELISRYEETKQISGYIFLRHWDIAVDGIVTEYPHIFAGKNKIYSNGVSQIYR